MTPEELRARVEADDLLDDGWANTFLVDPLLALAGGILGGTAAVVVVWRLMFPDKKPRP